MHFIIIIIIITLTRTPFKKVCLDYNTYKTIKTDKVSVYIKKVYNKQEKDINIRDNINSKKTYAYTLLSSQFPNLIINMMIIEDQKSPSGLSVV